MAFIIDGYNLLRSIEKTQEDFESISDVRLCRILGEYLRQIGEAGQIIFDGIGPPDKNPFENIRNLEVIFSGRNVEADTLIEDKIKADTAPKRLTIVSSDRRLRDAAKRRKSKSIKSVPFWSEVLKRLSRKKREKEPEGKRQGLTEAETEQWLKFFGIEE